MILTILFVVNLIIFYYAQIIHYMYGEIIVYYNVVQWIKKKLYQNHICLLKLKNLVMNTEFLKFIQLVLNETIMITDPF